MLKQRVRKCARCGSSSLGSRVFPANSKIAHQRVWVASLGLDAVSSKRELESIRDRIEAKEDIRWCPIHFDEHGAPKAAQIRSLDGDDVQEKRRKVDDLDEDAVDDSGDIEGTTFEGNEQGNRKLDSFPRPPSIVLTAAIRHSSVVPQPARHPIDRSSYNGNCIYISNGLGHIQCSYSRKSRLILSSPVVLSSSQIEEDEEEIEEEEEKTAADFFLVAKANLEPLFRSARNARCISDGTANPKKEQERASPAIDRVYEEWETDARVTSKAFAPQLIDDGFTVRSVENRHKLNQQSTEVWFSTGYCINKLQPILIRMRVTDSNSMVDKKIERESQAEGHRGTKGTSGMSKSRCGRSGGKKGPKRKIGGRNQKSLKECIKEDSEEYKLIYAMLFDEQFAKVFFLACSAEAGTALCESFPLYVFALLAQALPLVFFTISSYSKILRNEF
ncbi:hypothetical protein PRIPAC_93707 [Pristionchus pacificus]|uniref:Uncharacterized protein n=1 Tax=Pristionchus pacificus TaxID=54126 RepID=A0A2A6C9A8_PRIPA|nr:hypothetical protein PRIPAC_93707 [Pristionchus pacificus]|eukprot:PDM74792.1 hypothetical protein PRIPAC_43382 [Pristionchus pacificus]